MAGGKRLGCVEWIDFLVIKNTGFCMFLFSLKGKRFIKLGDSLAFGHAISAKSRPSKSCCGEVLQQTRPFDWCPCLANPAAKEKIAELQGKAGEEIRVCSFRPCIDVLYQNL